jgi:hypothetical protein
MQKRLKRPSITWPSIIIVVIGAVLLLGELLFRLSSLTYHHLSLPEATVSQYLQSWHYIINNPLGAPLVVLQKVTQYISTTSVFWLRVPSVLTAAIGIGLFYYIVLRWLNRFTAIISTLLLASSAIFLHIARMAALDVLFFVIPLLLCAYATHTAKKNQTAIIPLWAVAGLLAIGLYIPAFIWLCAVLIILQPSLVIKPWLKSGVLERCLSILLALVLLIPLVRAFILHPRPPILSWLGVGHLGHPADILHRLLVVPYNLFLHGPANAALWLGHIPIMPFAITILVLLGVYELILKRRRQAYLTLSFLLVGWLICGIGGVIPLAVLIGPLYILVAAGIRHLSDQWFRVFPRNPVARGIGYGAIAVFCLFMITYGWHTYFVAWPHNPATHQVFTITPTGDSRMLLQ